MTDEPLGGGQDGNAAVSFDHAIGDTHVHVQGASFDPMGYRMVSFARSHFGQSRYAERVCHFEWTGR